jgi:hypothetical protein
MLTLNDVKQEISYVYLHALVTHLGYSLERTCIDRDSVDATICARGKIPGSRGIVLSPKIDVQLKATVRECSGNPVPFSLSKKNYDDLRQNTMVPRMLIVLFLPVERTWLDCDFEKIVLYGKGYWVSLKGMSAVENQSSKTIHLNQSQRLTDEVIQQWMVTAANREEISYVSC